MKRTLIAIALLLVSPCLVGAETTAITYGWQRNVTVEWGYTPPSDPAVSGFQLYQDGEKVCKWDGPDARTGDCALKIEKRNTPFTLTALFGDGTESPHSAPFILVDPMPSPILKSLKITIELVQP